ncbi:MAG: class I SAM-dependent methyltransferase [Phycisphaerales bacterium]|nr:MAG: class I SAM-dependent methyltransferase [Phycisphaerales bacterium]
MGWTRLQTVSDGERDTADDPINRPRIMRETAMYEFCLPFVAGRRVVDVGCGTGFGTALLAKQAGSVIGVDPHPIAVETARAGYQADNLFFRQMDGTSLDFDDASIDVVVSMGVIEHIKRYSAHFTEAARILAPSGLFILGALNARLSLGDDAYHYKEFDHEELKELMDRHFIDVEVYGVRGVTPAAIADWEQRIARAKRYWRVDFLRLRRFYFFKCFYRPLFNYLQRRGRKKRHTGNTSGITSIRSSDFSINKEDLPTAWNFICIGKKP